MLASGTTAQTLATRLTISNTDALFTLPVLGGSFDSSGAMTLGGASATSLAIGRSGITTDFPSGSTVDFTGATVTGISSSGVAADDASLIIGTQVFG